MTQTQLIFLISLALFSAAITLKAYNECKAKDNAFGTALWLTPLGIFVWGDAVVFGLFWTLVALAMLIVKDWLLFLLIIAVFWFIRSLGETIYWLNQQFSTIDRNPPQNFWIYKIFHNDSVWFVYQITWQCVSVVSIVSAVYLIKVWLA